MSDAIDKLLSLVSEPLGPPIGSSTARANPRVGELIDMVLSRVNGFYAFGAALHVFPTAAWQGGLGLDSWNAPELWRNRYGDMGDDFIFFAEDAFGGQFAIKGDLVYSFEPETGEASQMTSSVEGWARQILDDFEVLTGYSVAHEWQLVNGPIKPGHRLVPRQPFVLGGEFDAANLVTMEAAKGMRIRGELAVQLRDLPDGASVTFKIVD